MASNVQAFRDTLREFTAKVVPELANETVRYVGLQGLNGLVKKTPVDTGYARAGWQVTLSAPAESETALLDRGGQATISAGSAVIKGAGPFPHLFITNPVEYIEVLEDGRLSGEAVGEGEFAFGAGVLGVARRTGARGSIQAPNGMLGVTFEELIQSLEQVEEVA